MIYIQSDHDNLPHHFDAACALYGSIDLNERYKLVTFEQVESGKFDLLIKNNLFVGSVEFMTEVFNRVGKFPDKLPNNDREKFATLGEVRQRIENGEKLFVKPKQIKLFTGAVFDEYFINTLREYSDQLEVIIDEPFSSDILSEWRIYIKEGNIVDSRNYSGDVNLIYDIDRVNQTLESFKDIAICFTLDFAVLENETKLIEINDMWAIGNYGIPNDRYVSMLRRRYFEIVR